MPAPDWGWLCSIFMDQQKMDTGNKPHQDSASNATELRQQEQNLASVTAVISDAGDASALHRRVAELEKLLADATSVASILYHALDDASTVVDPGSDEDYAYQAELEAGAALLGIERAQGSHKIDVLVVVTGTPSDPEDSGVPGTYGHSVTLSRNVDANALTPDEAGAIAQAVLDEFHDRQGIECLDDFDITLQLANGVVIEEMDDTSKHFEGLVERVEHLNKVDDGAYRRTRAQRLDASHG